MQTIHVEEAEGRVRLRFLAQRVDVRVLRELSAALDHVEDKVTAPVVVLHVQSEGMAFSEWDPDGALDIHGFNTWEKLVTRLERLRKLTVAVADGPCHGPGLQLLLACDLRVATPSAGFSLPEVTQGYLPGMATWRLARYVGLGRAKRIVLSGEVLSADEALGLGILDGVSADAELAEQSGVAMLGPAHAVAGTLARRLLLESFDTQNEDALGHFLAAQARAIAQPAFADTLRRQQRAAEEEA
jgi:isomerase DpgB